MRFNTEEDKIRVLASQISVLLLDVDGVLTDGKLLFSSSGEELKAFCSLDGHGIKMLLRAGVQVGITLLLPRQRGAAGLDILGIMLHMTHDT